MPDPASARPATIPIRAWPVQAAVEYATLLALGPWRNDPALAKALLPAGAGLLLLWLWFRGGTLRQQAAGRTPVSSFHWLESHLTGLSLGLAAIYVALDVSLATLVAFAIRAMGALLVVELVFHDQARTAVLRQALRRWSGIWPRAGELVAILLAFWTWLRLTGTEAPGQALVWVGGTAGAVIGLTRGVPGVWPSLLAPASVLPPLLWAYTNEAGEPNSRIVFLAVLLAVAALLHRLLERGPGRHSAGLAAGWALVLTGGWLAEPLLHDRAAGGGDAQWYAQVLADAIAQFHAGIFPPLIGQSEFAFSGAVFPNAVAPLYALLGLAVDTLAGGALNPYAVQHAIAFLSLTGGLVSAYLTLRWLSGAGRPACVLIAILYGSSPAWLGALYSMDMYMTVLTLPWIPLVLGSVLHAHAAPTTRGAVAMAASLALCWLAHPPLALWTMLAAAVMTSCRWMQRLHHLAEELRWAGNTAGLFLLLVSAPLCLGFYTEGRTDPFRTNEVLRMLAEHWHAAWRPVSATASLPSDQQLGWSLALVGLLGFGLALRHRQRTPLGGLAAASFLLLLLAPIPMLQPAVWRAMPQPITALTDNWPTQRLLPVLAALVAVVGGTALLRQARHVGPLAARLLAVALIGACAWSLSEAGKFRERGHGTQLDSDASERRLLPENLVLTRYALHLFEHAEDPDADAVVDRRLVPALLAYRDLAPLAGNLATLRAQPGTPSLPLLADEGMRIARLRRGLISLLPARRYLLKFTFGPATPPGILTLRGERLARTYVFGQAGNPGRISPGAEENEIAVWTTGSLPEHIEITFTPMSADSVLPRSPGQVSVRSIDDRRLPVQILEESPLRERVQSPAEAWVETVRMHLPGYRAMVNGLEAETARSSRGLVLVRVPAGTSDLELAYVAPWPVRLALWLSTSVWAALTLAGLLQLRQSTRGEAHKPTGRLSPLPGAPV